MDTSMVKRRIEAQDWLDPVADAVQGTTKSVIEAGGPAGKQIEDALNGVWLGHALHPAVTDVPLGAWTVAAALDAAEAMTGRQDLASGADAAVAIGLAGALASAVTGLTQYYSLSDKPTRRVGAAHALINISATALYGISYALRKSGARSAGRAVGWLGYGVVSAGAYLGGVLVYDQKIGVDHAPRENLPAEFVPVLADTDLHEATPTKAKAGDIPLVLVRRGDHVFALADACSHLGGPLSEGKLEGDCIVCPWHGSAFQLADGSVEHGPAAAPQPAFETRVNGGQIEVRANPNLPGNSV